MTLSHVARFAFGDSGSIRRVASSGSSLWVGIALVLLTAVARNYDQLFVLETPFWLFGPLLFSFVSGGGLFWIVNGRVKTHLPGGASPMLPGQWRSFMGLFWMTAPIAWLYAIPVERFFGPMGAAQANLALLAVVSLWRVLLMSRVVAVVNEVPFLRAFGWILVAASLEVILVVSLGFFFGRDFGGRVLAGMSGMRNASDESLLLSALSVAWHGAWVVLLTTLIVLGLQRYRGTASPFPLPRADRIPWLGLIVLSLVWIAIAWPAQLEQYRFARHARLIREGRHSEALAYLGAFERDAFPPSRRLEPNPFEPRVWRHLPPTIALLNTNTPSWIRQTYLSHLAATFKHYWPGYDSPTNVARMYAAIEKLPESRAWLRSNEAALVVHGVQGRFSRGSEEHQASVTNILNTLQSMGMSETNLTKLVRQ